MTPWRIVLGSCRANSRWVGSFVFRIYIYLTFPRNWIEMKICLKWNAYELCGKTGSEIPCIELIWKVYRNVSWNAMHELIYDAYVWIGAVDAHVRIDLWCICMNWCGGRTGKNWFMMHMYEMVRWTHRWVFNYCYDDDDIYWAQILHHGLVLIVFTASHARLGSK